MKILFIRICIYFKSVNLIIFKNQIYNTVHEKKDRRIPSLPGSPGKPLKDDVCVSLVSRLAMTLYLEKNM
jgi:hypothetical protein